MACSCPQPFCRHGQSGFTLVELMVVVGIVAVFVGMALPAFQRMIVRTDVQKAARNLAATVQTSRLLAMNQNVTVAVLPTLAAGSDGQQLVATVVNANTGAPLVNITTGATISAGLQQTAVHLTTLSNAGGGPATQVAFSPQGLLAPVGAPATVWVLQNVPQNTVYMVSITPGGRVRWCEVPPPPSPLPAPGAVCP